MLAMNTASAHLQIFKSSNHCPLYLCFQTHLLSDHQLYLERCVTLAKNGAGLVAPNPMVGAVLVCNKRIIGEGWHNQFGKAHAEVNCIESVRPTDRALISQSTLYVSLEPCAHFGKTPPCTDLIIQQEIPRVVIGCRDPFGKVNGKGIEKLQASNIQVELATGADQKKCLELNKRFFTFHANHRPYVILKWAQTSNGFIGSTRNERLLISNQYTNRVVHQWRSEEAAILVGTKTAFSDNPELTNRHWPGPSPLRIVIDRHLIVPATANVFNNKSSTIIFNTTKHDLPKDLTITDFKAKSNNWLYQLHDEEFTPGRILAVLYELGVQSILVEGGAKLLQSFIDARLWDEARIITNNQSVSEGLTAPVLKNATSVSSQQMLSDEIRLFLPMDEAVKNE